jgi:hypothetical protein
MAFRGSEVVPEWESVPWDLEGSRAKSQEYGFRQRAALPLDWQPVPWADFPADGLLGRDAGWYRDHEVAFWATRIDEDLYLIRRLWHGWPDPPEWGLISERGGDDPLPLAHWGSFDTLPRDWRFPPGEPG